MSRAVLILACLSLLFAAPARAVERINAVQIGVLAATDEKELGTEFAALRADGIDTVIVRAFHNPRDRFYPFVTPAHPAGVYFRTDQAPVVADALGELIRAARAADLRIFAWMTTLSTVLDTDADLRGRTFDLTSGEIRPGGRLDPFHPEVRRRLGALYQDLARYDLDGILFQDDLVLRHTEGFSAHGLSAYRARSGAFPDPQAYFADRVLRGDGQPRVRSYAAGFRPWSHFKRDALLELAGHLRDQAREVRPQLRFALNLMYEVLSDPRGALNWLSQDFAAARAAGFDYLSIMAYQRQMARELGTSRERAAALIEAMVNRALAEVDNPARLLFKVQAAEFPCGTPLAAQEWQPVRERIRSRGPVSLAVYPYLPAEDLGSGSDFKEES